MFVRLGATLKENARQEDELPRRNNIFAQRAVGRAELAGLHSSILLQVNHANREQHCLRERHFLGA